MKDAVKAVAAAVVAELVVLLLVPLASSAQERQPDVLVDPTGAADPMAEADPWKHLADGELVDAVWDSLHDGRFVRGLELAEELLSRDPESIPGHCFMGVIQHRSEANLPVAVFHLRRCRSLVEKGYGRIPAEDEMVPWHALALIELASVYGSMGDHAQKLRYLDEHDSLYEPGYPADRGWPLMRLRRYDEAREAVADAMLLVDRPDQVATARTALCAIEAEEHHREAAYRACLEAAEMDRYENQAGPTTLSNAAEAALGMLELDEAERYLLEATQRFVSGTVSNPWLDLMQLYLSEGRVAEALDAMRRMFRWRHRQPAFMDEQNRAETELASAIFLTLAGRPEEATVITERTLRRPDRTGFTSSESEQMEAANALVDAMAQRLAAEMAAETASWSPFWDAMKARLEERRRRAAAWSSERRVAALLAHERILLSTIRPYLAGSIELPEWLAPEIVAILGPGVVEAAVRDARARETLDATAGYFLAHEAEAAYLRGHDEEALALADQAIEKLPGSEVLLSARIAAVGAQSALDAGLSSRAMELFDWALQLDPGVVRRLGLALPAVFEIGSGEIAEMAGDHLRDSPRFAAAASGFRVRVDEAPQVGRACLLGPSGSVLGCAEVSPRAGETPDALARRLAKEFHATVFAPRVDLTQADLRSLDGSPTAASGRSSERLQRVLTDLVGGEADPSP